MDDMNQKNSPEEELNPSSNGQPAEDLPENAPDVPEETKPAKNPPVSGEESQISGDTDTEEDEDEDDEEEEDEPPRKTGFRKRHIILLALAAFYMIYGLGKAYINDSGATNKVTQPTSIHFLDVGEGDCSLIVSGEEAILVDAGPADTADEVVSYLQELGVREFIAVVATNNNDEHIGGMHRILETFPTTRFYKCSKTADSEAYQSMIAAAEAQGLEIATPGKGSYITFASGAKFSFVYAGGVNDGEGEVENNASIVTRLIAGKNRVLLMSDVEGDAERRISSSSTSFACNIIKIGNNGSASSSNDLLIKRCKADTAVISCSAEVPPAEQTVKTLETYGIAIRTTAEEGTIVYDFAPNAESAPAA